MALGLLGPVACSSDSGSDGEATTTAPAETTAPARAPVVTQAWARTSPAGVTTGAAHFTVTSPVADGTTTTMAMGGSGEMTMQEVAAIRLPAGRAVDLKSGGYHVMLMGLAAPLETGATIRLTLISGAGSDGRTRTYVVEPGTADRIASGERVRVMPAELRMHVGDTLVIRNRDRLSAVVGPYTVGAGLTFTAGRGPPRAGRSTSAGRGRRAR